MIENISNYVPAKDVWDIVNNVYQKSLRNSDELFWQSIFNCLILILKKNTVTEKISKSDSLIYSEVDEIVLV